MNGIIPGACCLEKTEGKGIQEQGENARGGPVPLGESWDLLFWESHSSSHRAPATDTSRLKKKKSGGGGDHCQTLTPCTGSADRLPLRMACTCPENGDDDIPASFAQSTPQDRERSINVSCCCGFFKFLFNIIATILPRSLFFLLRNQHFPGNKQQFPSHKDHRAPCLL